MKRFLSFLARLIAIAAIALLLLSPKVITHLPAKWSEALGIGKKETEIRNENVELAGPVAKNFKWEYKDKDYSVDLNLYSSLYEYYKKQPRSYQYQGALPSDWKDQYAGMFLNPLDNDASIGELADAIRSAGQKNKLTDDQIAESAIAFIQSVPYDDAGAAALKDSGYSDSDVSYLPRYPYETLYADKGICSDKSFLAYLLLKKLGYGVAIFEYADQHHMAIGIQCPKEYSTYGSGYCYAETTTENNIIGIVPELDSSDNKPVSEKEMPYFQSGSVPSQELANPDIIQKTSGKTYGGIAVTIKAQNRIAELKKTIYSLNQKLISDKKQLDDIKNDVDEMADDLDKYKKKDDYKKYNSLVDDYNDKVNEYKKEISAYNAQVNSYNAQIKEYNQLIKTLYS